MKYSEQVFWFWWTIGLVIVLLIFMAPNETVAFSFDLVAILCICLGSYLRHKFKKLEKRKVNERK
jgi:hypothetical protein